MNSSCVSINRRNRGARTRPPAPSAQDEPDPAAVRDGLERLLRDGALRARLVRNALKTAGQFHICRVAGHLREVLQNGAPSVA